MADSDRPAAPLLAVRGVLKRFGGLVAVNNCSLDVAPGTVTALIGPNGSGKTTLFHLITGMLQPDGGDIYLAGQRITGLPPHRINRLGLSRTFQLTRVFGSMTLLENLVVAAAGGSERQQNRRAMDLLRFVGLAEKRDHLAGTLSYGQRRLLEFARALMPEPRLVLLDEPFAGVNPVLEEKLVSHIRDLHRQGVTCLIIDHEMKIIMSLCDPVIVLSHGEVIAQGPPDQVRNDPQVMTAYFGETKGVSA